MAQRTCLYDMHIKYRGKMVDFAGFELPIQYQGIMAEHECTRKAVGLFDVSHMGKFQLSGDGALGTINQLITNDLKPVVDGQAIYSPMCYEDGGTVDDVLVYRYSQQSFLMVVNAANKSKDYEWVKDHLLDDTLLVDLTDSLCQIAVQGPKAVALLQSISPAPIQDMPYYHFLNDVELAGVQMLLSRTGYTGEDGFELYFHKDKAHEVWESLLQHGADFGIQPCGLGARDTLRFEAGMPLYGNELSEDINPIEAGLNYFVKLDKGNFIGRQALARAKDLRQRKSVGFELIGKGIARHGSLVVNSEGEEIGLVTTGYKSPTLGLTLGLAIVPWDYQEKALFIKVRNKVIEAKIVKRRFLQTYKQGH